LLPLQQLAEQVQSRTSCLAAEAIDIGMVNQRNGSSAGWRRSSLLMWPDTRA
jgi:hypothetical protein